MTKNILITGGAGFIGSNFVRYLLKRDATIRLVNLDALTYAGGLDTLADVMANDRHIFVHGDIRDRALVVRLMEEYDVETVVNFAAESHVDRSIVNSAPFIETNVAGTVALLEAARSVWAKRNPASFDSFRFHHISTDEVYGSLDPQSPPFSEDSPYSPNSPYAASKAAGDHFVNAYFMTHRLPAVITNCSNNYGPYQHPEKFIPLVISNALAGKDIPIYGDGGQMRDWLFIEDHCEALFSILEKGVPGESYNIAGNNRITNLELVQKICSLLDELTPDPTGSPRSRLIRFVADRPGHDRCYGLDTTKIFKATGWQPRHTLDQGIKKTIAWYLENQAWVSKRKENSTFDWASYQPLSDSNSNG